MDNRLRILQRQIQAHPTIINYQLYTTALEQALGFSNQSTVEPIYLLSHEGERHEDRIPKAIFTSKKLVIDYIIRLVLAEWEIKEDELRIEEHEFLGDYGPQLEISIWDATEDSNETLASYVLEKFEVNPT